METHLPLFSSSLTTTLLLDTSNIQCSQFTTFSDHHMISPQHDQTDIIPRPRSTSPPTSFIPDSSATWKLTKQFYTMDAASLMTTSTPSTIDDHWFYVPNHLQTIPDDNHQDDCWSLISAPDNSDSGKLMGIKGMAFFSQSIQLVSRYMTTRPVLQGYMAEKLREWLPLRVAAFQQQWKLLYSLDQHGASIQTFYQRVVDQGPCLLAIQDSDDNIFGVFISESIKINTSFYGSGESFLWRCKLIEMNMQHTPCFEHYPWTTKNNYFIYSDKSLIGFGNGTGQFGLCLDEGIENGTSSPCPTFDNPSLTSSTHFKCIGLEVWSVS